MLATPRARSNGPGLVLGWVLGLPLVGSIVLLVGGTPKNPLLVIMRHRMERNNSAIMSVICLLIAAKLVDDAISDLSSGG